MDDGQRCHCDNKWLLCTGTDNNIDRSNAELWTVDIGCAAFNLFASSKDESESVD